MNIKNFFTKQYALPLTFRSITNKDNFILLYGDNQGLKEEVLSTISKKKKSIIFGLIPTIITSSNKNIQGLEN